MVEGTHAAQARESAAAGRRALSARRRKRAARPTQLTRKPSLRVGVSRTAFLLCSPPSLLLLLTSAAAAANRKRLPIARETANPSAAQNSAARRDLPAPANPAS